MKTLQKKSRHCKSFAVTAPSFLKNIIFFLSFLLLGVGSELKAQQSPKWEIGTDLLWLVGKNSLPDYSLFGRYKLSQRDGLRARIGLSTSFANSSIPRLWDKGRYMVRIGYERNKVIIEDRLIAYYGADFHYSYGKSYILNPYGAVRNVIYTNDLLDANQDYIYRFDKSIGGVLFGGIKYHFVDFLSISLETSLSALNSTQRLKPSFDQGQRRSVNYWDTAISPISVLNFSFHF